MKKIKVAPIKSPEVCKKCMFDNCEHPYYEYCAKCRNSFFNIEENNGGKIFCCNCEYTDIGKPCKHFERKRAEMRMYPDRISFFDADGNEIAYFTENKLTISGALK